ncbi:hypothetical protein HJG60_007757 [Phyllostomus discolor]|uniref:Secreted protein n=1 Tax=Phyllostomus discolor TaxID=89673 RepID=A0A834BHD5_9CHIR|nr:hypothetical protein HJG60_007757 [Phyllostomus discolor]
MQKSFFWGLLRFIGSFLLATHLCSVRRRGRGWEIKLRCQFPARLTPRPVGCPGEAPREPPRGPLLSSTQPAPTCSHHVTRMPGLSHPKAQRLCLRPPTAEGRAFCFSFLCQKPALQRTTRGGRPPSLVSTLPQLCSELPPVGTCHLPGECLSWGEAEAEP